MPWEGVKRTLSPLGDRGTPYNEEAGTKALTTETGTGQWGSALAMACNFVDLALDVYMVKVSYHQKPYRRIIMENVGVTVYPTPASTPSTANRSWPRTPTRPARWASPHLQLQLLQLQVQVSPKRSRPPPAAAAPRNTRSARCSGTC